MKELKKGRKLRGEKGVEEWERHKGERKGIASGIEREKCLRERDIFRPWEWENDRKKVPLWWEISLRGRENFFWFMEALVLAFVSM